MIKPPYVNRQRNLYNVNSSGVSSDYGPRDARIISGAFSSVSTPGWPPRGGPPPGDNPFLYELNLEDRADGAYGGFYGSILTGWTGNCYGQIPGTSRPFPSPPQDDTRAKALAQVRAKCKDMDVNILQAFAERKQTVDLLGKRINQIAQAALALKRGDLIHMAKILGIDLSRHVARGNRKIRKVRRFAKFSPGDDAKDVVNKHADTFGNLWLEYSYGWRPLVQDCYGAIEQLKKSYDTNKPKKVVGSAEIVVPLKNFVVKTTSYSGGGRTSTSTELANGNLGLKTRVVARFAVDNVRAREFANTGFSNPAALAWELLPYSFVVDWFLPIGDYLNAQDACNGLTFLNGTITTRVFEQYNTNWVNDTQLPWHLFVRGCNRSIVKTKKVRVPIGFLPLPSFPSLQSGLSVSHFASGLALLNQAFKR